MGTAVPTPSLGFQNFFSATLSSDITASATGIPLDTIPNSSEGFLVIDPDNSSREVIYYTSKTSLQVTCPDASTGRGQDDTTAVAHTQGATVIASSIAAYFEALQSGNSIAAGAITLSKLGAHIKAGSFAAKGSSGTQAITGVGFQPSVVFFFLSTTSGTNACGGIGFMTSTSQYSYSWAARNGAGTQSSVDTSNAVRLYTLSAGGVYTADQLAAYSSMDSDGFTINYSTSVSSGETIGYIAIG